MQAQDISAEHKKAIEAWMAQPEKGREPIKLRIGGPIGIAPELLKDLRHDFEKVMVLAGHGKLFDAGGRSVDLSRDDMEKLQSQMLEAISKDAEAGDHLSQSDLRQLTEIADTLRKTLATSKLSRHQRFLVQNNLIRALTYRVPVRWREGYDWRGTYLRGRWEIVHKFERDALILELDEDFLRWFRDWWARNNRQKTSYMQQCEDNGVPLPPDFALSGTPWVKQGELQINMLDPGLDADVYTWAPGHMKGACVALPRYLSNGTPGLAGILCQGFDSGNACIWDSFLMGSNSPIDWSSQTMVIKDLKDGTVLSGCPGCHLSNNAFNVAPDDPTWCSLMRGGQHGATCGTMSGPNRNNFTMQIADGIRTVTFQNSNGPDVDHSRFSWLSGTPPRASWVNNPQVGCGMQCHLAGDAAMLVREATPEGAVVPRQDMEPDCDESCN